MSSASVSSGPAGPSTGRTRTFAFQVARAARFRVARVDEEALEPGVEAVRIAEAGQLTPGDHQRLLHGILGPSDVPEDPLGDRHEPVAMRPGQDGERLPVPALGLLDEIAIQPIVLLASMRDAFQGDAFRLY